MIRNWKLILIIFLLCASVAPVFVLADTHGQKQDFFIDETYDISGRKIISATLRQIGIRSYFYIEDQWWDSLSDTDKQAILSNISSLSQEFDNRIYPLLTITYGGENNPGIDADPKITILIQQMKERVGGYDRNLDEYYKAQAPSSNQREMIYLAADYIHDGAAKNYLAHEFTHLIIFNQKNKILGVDEEVWLSELLADYSPTLLGYDDTYQGSNLQSRVGEFINNPSDALLEWDNQQSDYAMVNLFAQYLVDHYSLSFFINLMHSSQTGIDAINQVLQKAGSQKQFADVFNDWTLSVYLNDCTIGQYYCFKNQNLINFRLTPALIFLPATSQTNIQLTYNIQNWSAKWFKIIGGNKGLEVSIKNLNNANLVVPYVLKKDGTEISVKKLTKLDQTEKITLPEFATENISLILIPSLQEDIAANTSYNFTINIATIAENNPVQPATDVQTRIAQLQQQLVLLQNALKQLLASQGVTCNSLFKNLYPGMINDSQVKCLQKFLASQQGIYPEGYITGNFGSLTKQAVIRFQEKYSSEILTPLGLIKGTGNAGPTTRQKINQLISK